MNWDIPWSLVRLEQRMGRIHRVGQTRDVELYNPVATGTNEGQVLEVLLSNFVVAANQLDGKMFDSLSLLAELVNLDFEQTLARTYDSPERASAALATAKAATAEWLAAAAKARGGRGGCAAKRRRHREGGRGAAGGDARADQPTHRRGVP
ncbi:MAG: hypothetical protein M5T61_09170 [Acidimicrobiia bacterium]|nr:hypothetical protein [Acidimicrobiia bacterium]